MTTKYGTRVGRMEYRPKKGDPTKVELVRKRGYMAANRAKKADREAKNWAKKSRTRTP